MTVSQVADEVLYTGLLEMQELGCSGIGISLKFGPLSAFYITNIIDRGLKRDFGKMFFLLT